MKIPENFKSLRVRASIVILLAVSVVLSQLPLFDYLGYEFSVTIAVIFSILGGFLTIAGFRSRFKNGGPIPVRDIVRFCRDESYLYGVLLFLPLLIVTLNMIRVKNCSYAEGLGFYFLIPGVTVLFSVALAVFCAVVFRRARFMYFCFLLLIIGHVVWLGYGTPQIYAYNLVLGFFPGISYDEVLTIEPTLVIFRTMTLLVAVWLMLVVVLVVRNGDPGDTVLTKSMVLARVLLRECTAAKNLFLACTVILVGIWLFRVDLHFETSTEAIRKQLDGTIRTEHFVIHFAKGSFDEEELPWVGAEHEFRLYQIAARLQVPLSSRALQGIQSYIYPTDDVKRRFVGTGSTNIAKPWRREMHINRDSWRQVLKHELVHVVAGEFGMPVIRANYNVGLVEGLAMAVEWEFGNRTLHEYAAAMNRFGLVKDPGRLLSLSGFAMQASTVSYVLSGSFCRFLLDRYGIVRFKEVYGGRPFERAYGKESGELVQEWQLFLRRVSIPTVWKPHVDYFFNRKSIFAQECARHIARLNERAFHELQHNDAEVAAHFFRASLQESWNTDAFTGLVRAMFTASRYDSVIELIDSRPDDRTSRSSSIWLLYGDSQWESGNTPAAETAYREALALDVAESMNEASALRLAVLGVPRLRYRLRPVFVGALSDSERLALLDSMNSDAVVSLLKAQVSYRTRDYRRTLELVRQSTLVGENPVLMLLREKLVGRCSFYLKEFGSARASFWQAMNYTTNEASRLRLNDWIDRCEWEETMQNAKWKMENER